MRMFGFNIYKAKTTSKESKVYEYWMAQKRIGGKLKTCHIGKDASKAQEKILEFCKKNGIQVVTNEVVLDKNVEELVAELKQSSEKLALATGEINRLMAELKTAKANQGKLNAELRKLRRIWNDEFDLAVHPDTDGL